MDLDTSIFTALIGLFGVCVGGVIQVALAMRASRIEEIRRTRALAVEAATAVIYVADTVSSLAHAADAFLAEPETDNERLDEYVKVMAPDLQESLDRAHNTMFPVMAAGDAALSASAYDARQLLAVGVASVTKPPAQWDTKQMLTHESVHLLAAGNLLLAHVHPRPWERIFRFRTSRSALRALVKDGNRSTASIEDKFKPFIDAFNARAERVSRAESGATTESPEAQG